MSQMKPASVRINAIITDVTGDIGIPLLGRPKEMTTI
jgi:hypothetical protein